MARGLQVDVCPEPHTGHQECPNPCGATQPAFCLSQSVDLTYKQSKYNITSAPIALRVVQGATLCLPPLCWHVCVVLDFQQLFTSHSVGSPPQHVQMQQAHHSPQMDTNVCSTNGRIGPRFESNFTMSWTSDALSVFSLNPKGVCRALFCLPGNGGSQAGQLETAGKSRVCIPLRLQQMKSSSSSGWWAVHAS